ncbi:hypothetical protein E6O75_ATG07949 [Venturia nashicola]|uniref:Uncharacterized protein n=1 Tax=Venturia nashicola TaxID=86259 RepID=A0A4Z1NIS2_9PEZI|nr:hypothetical protein E6O75_ATG07949 [Venturia nashicola]
MSSTPLEAKNTSVIQYTDGNKYLVHRQKEDEKPRMRPRALKNRQESAQEQIERWQIEKMPYTVATTPPLWTTICPTE